MGSNDKMSKVLALLSRSICQFGDAARASAGYVCACVPCALTLTHTQRQREQQDDMREDACAMADRCGQPCILPPGAYSTLRRVLARYHKHHSEMAKPGAPDKSRRLACAGGLGFGQFSLSEAEVDRHIKTSSKAHSLPLLSGRHILDISLQAWACVRVRRLVRPLDTRALERLPWPK